MTDRSALLARAGATAKRRRSRTPPRRPRLRAPGRWVAPAFLCVALAAASVSAARPVAEAALGPIAVAADPSAVVLDRHGTVLRAFLNNAGRWRLPVALDAVDPRFVTLLLAYEDRRFARHDGIDRRALIRAAWQLARHGRIVSGGSTLTMQTVRLLTGARDRTPARKLAEIVHARRLERRIGKAGVLTAYLARAPYGGNIEGVRAASLTYFGREPARLTLAQAALLIALPQAPEARRPDRHPAAARTARDRVIARLKALGVVSEREAAAARATPVPTRRIAMPLLAPHLTRELTGAARSQTTLDAAWQRDLEALAKATVGRIAPRTSAAIVVADIVTGAVRAHVGAADFWAADRAGHVDMARAVRSPGSTLKPFVVALAIDQGLVAPETLVEDAPSQLAGYEPQNFDGTFQGTVTVAEALRHSLNVPAVTLLNAVEPARLAARLRAAGATVALPEGKRATLALGLGGFGTRLTDLAMLYTALARGGVPVPLHHRVDTPSEGRSGAQASPPMPLQHPIDKPGKGPAQRLVGARAADATAEILRGMRPPQNRPAGVIAYKTGTSYGHRDALAIGFDARHVVAVWVGRPDGTPVPTLTGYTDAAPLLFDTFARIGIAPRRAGERSTPTAALPPPLRRFPPPGARAQPRLTIAYPPDGATLQHAPATTLVARALGTPVDTWLLNGRPVDTPRGRHRADIAVGPGHHTLTAVTADGVSARVRFAVP